MGPVAPNQGIGEALFSGVQQRVLAQLFGNPDRSFYGNELQRLTKSGKGALQRELERLTGAGLVEVETFGRQKHYRANRAAPVFEELHGIVVKTFGLADVLRNSLLQHAGAIEVAFVYGSVAKRSDTARSDIDLFVVSDILGYQDLLQALASAESMLGRKINPTLYSRAELDRKRAEGNSFVTRVLDQPKIFLVGGTDELESREPGQDRQAEGGASGAA